MIDFWKRPDWAPQMLHPDNPANEAPRKAAAAEAKRVAAIEAENAALKVQNATLQAELDAVRQAASPPP